MFEHAHCKQRRVIVESSIRISKFLLALIVILSATKEAFTSDGVQFIKLDEIVSRSSTIVLAKVKDAHIQGQIPFDYGPKVSHQYTYAYSSFEVLEILKTEEIDLPKPRPNSPEQFETTAVAKVKVGDLITATSNTERDYRRGNLEYNRGIISYVYSRKAQNEMIEPGNTLILFLGADGILSKTKPPVQFYLLGYEGKAELKAIKDQINR